MNDLSSRIGHVLLPTRVFCDKNEVLKKKKKKQMKKKS